MQEEETQQRVGSDESLLHDPSNGAEERRELLWGEYKILQDKLDRIGDFRFRVKQWSVTLVLALVVSGTALSTRWGLLLLSGIVVIASFAIMELFYDVTHRSFTARLTRIEYFLAGTSEMIGNRPARRRRIHVDISAPTPATARTTLKVLEDFRRHQPRPGAT